MGVGYIIGPKLASLNFGGGLIAWGLLVPILLYFMAPGMNLPDIATAGAGEEWMGAAINIWKFIVRPMAIGGMLVGACFTLFRMRNSLITGMKRSFADLKKAASGQKTVEDRTEADLPFGKVLMGVVLASIATFLIYFYFIKTGSASATKAEEMLGTNQQVLGALVATVVLVFAGFLFAAVSGYLVGTIGSSNNPISGLTLSTLLIAALLLLLVGMKGNGGVSAVLGVAAVVCVSSAVAGEMLQDLKVGHILGGTPWKMQIGDLIGVILAALVMFGPLIILNQGDIAAGEAATPKYEGGFGGPKLPAPQASLMAMLAKGIIGGEMAWPLIIIGMLMGIAMILMQVRSPMLISVGMYLPLDTTFAIFLGGIVKWLLDIHREAKKQDKPFTMVLCSKFGCCKCNCKDEKKEDKPEDKPADEHIYTSGQRATMKNIGVLLASGLIAGEALVGLLFAGFNFFEVKFKPIFENPSFITSMGVLVLIGAILVIVPLRNPGDPNAKVQEMDA